MASFYNNYYRYYKPYSPYHHLNEPTKVETPKVEESSRKKFIPKEKSSSYSSFGPIQFKNPFFQNMEEPIFEVFGIHLYLDDIIILGLLFFLYQAGVQDEMLFIALILLLLG